MNKLFKAILVLALTLAPSLAFGQFTSVQNTQITDSLGNPYRLGNYKITFIQDNSEGAAQPTIGGWLIFPTQFLGTLDNDGNLPTLSLADNNQVTPGGSKWRFTFCVAAGTPCFTTDQTITGASMNLTTTLKVLAASLNPVNAGSVSVLNAIRYPCSFSGADAGAKITNAIADLPSTGGFIDARCFEGAQTTAANPFASVTKPVKLILGAATLTISNAWDLPSNVTIEGVGPTSVIKMATGVNSQYAITSSSKSNIHLRNFKIDGNKANQTPSGGDRTGGITFTAVTNFSIRDLEIADPYHHGIQIKGASARFAISGNYIHDNTNGTLIIVGNAAVGDTIDDFDIEGNIGGPSTAANCIFTTGFAAGPTWGVSRGRIRGNTCFQAGDVAIEVGTGSDNIAVTGNTIYVTSAGKTGILARGTRNTSIIGNAIYSDGSGTQKAIYVWSETGDSTLSKHTIVGHNTARGFTGASTVAFEVGSAAAGAVDDVSFSGNKAPSATTKFTISANATAVQRFDNDDGINSSTATNLDFSPGTSNYFRVTRPFSIASTATNAPAGVNLYVQSGGNSQEIQLESTGATSEGIGFKNTAQNWSFALRSDVSSSMVLRDITGTTDEFTFTTGGQFTATSIAIGGGTALTTSNQTGTGSIVLATSPTLVTPALGVATATSLTSALYNSTTNCASSGGTCAAAPAGSVSIAAAATTVTVSTTAVTANSQIFVQEDSTLGTRLSVTCNTTTGRLYTVTTRTAATSFVITASAAPTTNPACLSYFIVN